MTIRDHDNVQVGISDAECVDLATAFRPFGFWRFDIEAGHFFATEEVYKIFSMEFTEGPMNLVEVSSKVHPDDLPLLMEAFEHTSVNKVSYHTIYRIQCSGSYKFIRTVGKYRQKTPTSGEIIGISYEFFDRVRTIGFSDL